MPTSGVKNRTFKEILKGTVRFEMPFFQRGVSSPVNETPPRVNFWLLTLVP
jgi:hypothetical protein